MGGEDRRENIVLGASLALCAVLLLVALAGIQGPSSLGMGRPDRVRALDASESPDAPLPTAADSRNRLTSPAVPADSRPEVAAVASVDASTSGSSNSERCTLSGVPLGYGSFGDDIFCLQRTLKSIGIFDPEPNGLYDDATFSSVLELQSLHDLLVDGIVGRKTGTVLGIWPLEPFTVERTPVPPPGAVDLWGMPLSSVATSGPDAPALPANSGSGYRLVYDRAAQRVWAVDENEVVIRSWLVSGSREGNEVPGTHKVYSRSKTSVSRDGESYFSYMVRWLKTRDDAIGFHSLPRRTFDDSSYQTEDELGIRLSSGCQRQADLDAEFTWRFAAVGTTVVVL